MALLPEFSFNAVVQPGGGKHDKIVLWIEHGIYHASMDDIGLLKVVLSQGQIFNRPGGSPNSLVHIRRASRPGINHPPPLVSGDYAFNFDPAVPSTETQLVPTKLRLNLNPTRFLRHQNSTHYIPPRQNFSATTARFFESEHESETDEFALDNQDNWIPNLPAFENLSNPGFVDRIVRDYLEGVLREIDADTQRAADTALVSFVQHPSDRRFNLRYVETYFEFAVPDSSSPHLVSSLERLLRSYNELSLTARDYRVAGPQPWNGMSRVITLKIRTGVILKLYSKTNKRLRFEVVHDLTQAPIPQLPEEVAADARRHTSRTFDGVYRMMRRGRTDASQIVNSILQHMRNRAALPATPKTSIDFFSDIIGAIGDSNDARLILSLLLERGGVTSTARLRSPLKKLNHAGVLRVQPRNRRREYVVTEQYQHPLQMLRRHAAFPHLTARHRTRIPASA